MQPQVKVEWKEGKWPSFNVMVSTAEGRPPFMTIRGCQIKSSAKGEFVAYPSRKKEDGTFFNFFYGADVFNRIVMEEANKSKPVEKKEPARNGSGFDDMRDDVPF